MAKYVGATVKFMHGNPDGFGMMYIGSTECRKNNLKRKKLNKNKN